MTEDSWRLEFSSSTYSKQSFPEIEHQNRFKLSFPDKEVDNCRIKLKQIGLDPNKWFVVLHLRESINSKKYNLQARDSEISNYNDFIKIIYESGGQVIRMGNSNFPKLCKSSLAIDYAHSEIKSDVIDCYLWSHCRWWTGNSNGAASAAYAFGATRLITDQWHWSNVGPQHDFFMPKTLVKGKRRLSISETVQSEVGRQMYVSKLRKKGFEIESATSIQLANAAEDLFRSTEHSANHYPKFMNIEIELSAQLRNIFPSQTMRIPPSYGDEMASMA
jgi:putative glycosyltransferase (TIGR04372 family)